MRERHYAESDDRPYNELELEEAFTACEQCGNDITVEEYNRTGTSEHCDNCIGDRREDGSVVGEDD